MRSQPPLLAGASLGRVDRNLELGSSALPHCGGTGTISAGRFVSRSDHLQRLVHLRQIFVRRCHRRKKAPAIDGRGKLAERSETSSSALSALHRVRAELFWVALPTSWVLFISAKNLLFKAMAPTARHQNV